MKSAITLAELEFGVAGSGEREAQNREALDTLIASHAVALDVILVTNNQADFAGHPGLRVENWVG